MKIGAGAFKMRCLQLMDEVQRTRDEIIITKRGRPVAKLVPLPSTSKEAIFGFLKGTVKIHGDIISPTGGPWDAQKP
jgi:prevent-host-death family protein